MKVNYKIDQPFGPVAASAGVFIFIAGIAVTYFSLAGIIFIIAGAFVGFTYSSTSIDLDGKKIKYDDVYFGLIKTGKWTKIEDNMLLGVKQNHLSWRAHSRSNRPLLIKENNYYIVLLNSNQTEIAPIYKATNSDKVRQELESLSLKLGLKTI
jgi:hypothetical protein